MDFLKDILGEELFSQFIAKVNEHNGNEANKDKQIKIANLASGEYVSKLKFDDITQQLSGKQTELESANGLIAELKKSNKGNEELQGKISQYESTVSELQAQLAETKLMSAVKVALLSEKAVDVDYLTYKLKEKLKEKGESLELDENEKIKGWEDKISGLKTQFPTQFETSGKDGLKVLGNNQLPGGNNSETLTRESLLKKPYSERMKIYNENPEGYKAAMNS